MRLLSWNIQSGRGCDGITDIYRIANHINSLGEFDLICLQEVARNFEDYCARQQMDQLKVISNEFNEYSSVWGTGFSWPTESGNKDKNQEFGNLTLTKFPPLDNKVHQLPMLAVPGEKQMPRVAIEAIVNSEIGPVSVINTHLAYHAQSERQQQLERLTLLDQERKDQILYPKKNDNGAYQTGPAPMARVLCGDFNFGTGYPEYKYQIENNWLDSWAMSNNDSLNPPTCGIFDHKQWPQGAHCRDYFWLSNELESIKFGMQIDAITSLSDHQPIMLEIDI